MALNLRPYQQDALYHIFNSQHDREVICLPTGAGKTFIFSTMTAAMVQSGKKICIAVNRRELLKQTVESIKKNYGITPATITAKSRNMVIADVYVCMVETLARRKNVLEYLHSVIDVLVIDECHIGNFFKILPNFKRIIGFSATPMMQKKNASLADYYHNIYVPIQVSELVEQGYLLKPETWAPVSDVDFSKIKISRTTNDYDEGEMGRYLSAPKYVQNTVDWIKRVGAGKRTIVYNANIDHSLQVNTAMRVAGLNAHHVDGTTPEGERRMILARLFEEQDCIINNVGILTFGFDCPEVEVILLNRPTKSLPLFLQMCGRGSRISTVIDKPKFTIIDMYSNIIEHGLWEHDQDWETLFHEKIKPKSKDGKEQAAPVKLCPECYYVCHPRTMECPECKYSFEAAEIASEEQIHLIKIGELQKKMEPIMDRIEKYGHNQYAGLHRIKEQIYKENPDADLVYLQSLFLGALPEWCRITGKKPNSWHKNYCCDEMKKYVEQKRNTYDSLPF